MKVGTAQTKMNVVKRLIQEYHVVKATIKYMDEEHPNTDQVKLTSYSEVKKYHENLKRRLITIEETFDKIFK